MRAYVWTIILPMLLGCSGKHVVAGQEKPKEERLKEGLPSWCQKTCARYDDCRAQDPDPCQCEGDYCSCVFEPDDCREDCEEQLTKLTHSAECVDLALQLQHCVDTSSCEQLNSDDENVRPNCFPSDEQWDTCKEIGQDDDPPLGDDGEGSAPVSGTAGGPVSYGGTPSTAGASYGGSGGYGNTAGSPSGGSSNYPSVHCAQVLPFEGEPSGEGGASDGRKFVCGETRTGCSNGHEYLWFCYDRPATGPGDACYQYVDGMLVGTWAGNPRASDDTMACPTLEHIRDVFQIDFTEN